MSDFSIVFQPLFHPGTTQPLTRHDLEEAIYQRRITLQKHRDHEAVKALAELLDLQAARATMQVIEPEQAANREHLCGQAYALCYTAGVLKTVLTHQEPEREEERRD